MQKEIRVIQAKVRWNFKKNEYTAFDPKLYPLAKPMFDDNLFIYIFITVLYINTDILSYIINIKCYIFINIVLVRKNCDYSFEVV